MMDTSQSTTATPAAQSNVVRLQLVSNSAEQSRRDTVRCLRELLAAAEAGEIVGVSYVVLSSSRKVLYGSCGEAHRDPAKAAAMSATLMHGTMQRIFGEGA